MKTGILFDLDGTLLDTLGDLTDATNYALTQFGCPTRSDDYIRSVVGNGALRQITLALPGKEDDPDPQAVLQVYKAYYRDHCNIKTAPYPGITEMLATLKERYPIGIVTNKPDAPAKALCAAHFPGVYTLGEVSGVPRKPQPDMIRQAMAALGVERCIYVGDSEVDIRTAENSGVPCLSVLWGLRTKQQLLDAGGVYLCQTPAELLETVEKLKNGK